MTRQARHWARQITLMSSTFVTGRFSRHFSPTSFSPLLGGGVRSAVVEIKFVFHFLTSLHAQERRIEFPWLRVSPTPLTIHWYCTWVQCIGTWNSISFGRLCSIPVAVLSMKREKKKKKKQQPPWQREERQSHSLLTIATLCRSSTKTRDTCARRCARELHALAKRKGNRPTGQGEVTSLFSRSFDFGGIIVQIRKWQDRLSSHAGSARNRCSFSIIHNLTTIKAWFFSCVVVSARNDQICLLLC
jgi:hypothetical protein